jgi:hypothetical protein
MKRTMFVIAIAATILLLVPTLALASGNGRATAMPAYYDGQIFTINFKEMPSTAETTLLARNGQLNFIYEVDPDQNLPFLPVLDAIPHDGMNPLWQEVEITYNVTPFQLVRDDDVLAAAAAGQIDLNFTTELYRCSVIGPKQ